MLAHHTINGCNLQPGDLIGTGTISVVDPLDKKPPGCRLSKPRSAASRRQASSQRC
jgi:2-keto-4-pentenoate hydratase/2-oxohepta-3-ene-1,7-dioic acid hydratase in catechol pathway